MMFFVWENTLVLPNALALSGFLKLATAWDRKVVLLRKRSLKEFKIPRLFLREDVPSDHKLRQKVFHVPPKDDAEKPPSAPTCSAPSILSTSSISDSQLIRSGSPALCQVSRCEDGAAWISCYHVYVTVSLAYMLSCLGVSLMFRHHQIHGTMALCI